MVSFCMFQLLYVFKSFVSESEDTAYIQSVCTYLVPFPVLSFSIVGVLKEVSKTGDSDDEEFGKFGITYGP